MAALRNLPTEIPKNLASLISYKKNQVVSMALSNSDHLQMSLFAFADQETISEEAYFEDTMYLVVEGETLITQSGKEHLLKEGDTLLVPAHTPHGVGGKGAFKLLQITLNEGE